VVVSDFNIMGITTLPAKTNTPLLVDPYTELPLSISAKTLQMVTWWNPQVINILLAKDL